MSGTSKRRPPKRLTPGDMRKAALDHLDRFAATRLGLAALLKRRALRSAAAHGDDAAPLLAEIEGAIRWLEAKGLLSDARYAEAKSRVLIGRGQSRRRIAGKLLAKGIDPDTAAKAIASLVEEFGDTDLAAARAYAKRRRLGRHGRNAEMAGPPSRRDLAAMARAGFSLETARRALTEDE